MKCKKCNNFIPNEINLCPYCGEKLYPNQENIDKENLNDQQNLSNQQNLNNQQNNNESNLDNWFSFSTEFIKKNFKDILIVSLLNNPFFFIITLSLVSTFYYSFLYNFAKSYKMKKLEINFNYKNSILEGLKLITLNFFVATPFIIILFILLTTLLLIILYRNNSFVNLQYLFMMIIYIITIMYITILVPIISTIKYFVIITLLEDSKISYMEIFKKVYYYIIKNWKVSLLLFILYSSIIYGLQTIITIMCYCSLGLILLFYVIVYLIIEIYFTSFILEEYSKK